MARKKREWNMSNPLYRYLHKKNGGKKQPLRRRSGYMARRRGAGRSGGSFGLGGMGGMKGLATKAVLGLGAVAALKMLAPQFGNNKIAQAGAGYVLGGIPAAAVAYLFGGNGGNGGNGIYQ